MIDVDPEIYTLTGLSAQIARQCIVLTATLDQHRERNLHDKRLAYHSAVKLAETAGPFNHRALYDRLFHITVVGDTARKTAFDAGAAQHAAEVYTALLACEKHKASTKAQSKVKAGHLPSPALEAVQAYKHASLDGPLAACEAALRVLTKYSWLPPAGIPMAWRCSLRSVQAKTFIPLLRGLADALDEALTIVKSVNAFLHAAQSLTTNFRKGSAARTLLPIFAREPVVTQGLVLKRDLMSDVAFQNGVKELEALGICVELTKRKRHRGWAAASRLLPKFEGFNTINLIEDSLVRDTSLIKSEEIVIPEGIDPEIALELDEAMSNLDSVLGQKT